MTTPTSTLTIDIDTAALLRTIRLVVFAGNKDRATDGYLTTLANIRVTSGVLRLAASNGYQLAFNDAPCTGKDINFCVLVRELAAWTKPLRNMAGALTLTREYTGTSESNGGRGKLWAGKTGYTWTAPGLPALAEYDADFSEYDKPGRIIPTTRPACYVDVDIKVWRAALGAQKHYLLNLDLQPGEGARGRFVELARDPERVELPGSVFGYEAVNVHMRREMIVKALEEAGKAGLKEARLHVYGAKLPLILTHNGMGASWTYILMPHYAPDEG